MKMLKTSIASGAIGLLLACGGGGGGGGTGLSSKIGGVAQDGYLGNAKVCVDLNLNFKCDAKEPFAITDAKGNYSIDWSGGDAAGLVVITETTQDTKDSDDGGITFAQAGRAAFVLAAPIPVGVTTDVQISPLTTVVTINALPEDGSKKLSAADITNAVKSISESYGVDQSKKDIMKMDISQDKDLKPIAQFMAITLGEIKKTATTIDAATMKSAVVAVNNATTSILENGALPSSVTDALKMEPAKRSESLANVPEIKSVIASTAKVINLGGSTVDAMAVLKGGLISAQFNNGYIPVNASKEGGIGDYISAMGRKYFSVSIVSYIESTGFLSEFRRVLDNGWKATADWEDDYYLLSSGQWLNVGKADRKLVFAGNCVLLQDHPDLPGNQKVCLDEKNLEGLLIKDLNASYCETVNGRVPDQNCVLAKFKAGSKGYDATISQANSDVYKIYLPNRASDKQNHRGIFYTSNVKFEATDVAQLLDFLVKQKETEQPMYMRNSFAFRIKSINSDNKSGVLNWYNMSTTLTPSTSTRPVVGESGFELRKVNGVDVLVVKIPNAYHQAWPGDMVGRDHIIAAKDKQIWDGELVYKDIKRQHSLNGYNWLGNRAMLESILEGNVSGGVALPPYPFPSALTGKAID